MRFLSSGFSIHLYHIGNPENLIREMWTAFHKLYTESPKVPNALFDNFFLPIIFFCITLLKAFNNFKFELSYVYKVIYSVTNEKFELFVFYMQNFRAF